MTEFRVMLVDDEPVIHKGLLQFVNWKLYNCSVVYQAYDGDEAWEKIPLVKPDIIIADIRMPGLSGLDLCRKIYNNYPRIKILLLTGYTDFNYVQQAIHYNVVDFLIKPTQLPMVHAALDKAIAQISKETDYEQKDKIALEKQANDIRQDEENNLRQLMLTGSCESKKLLLYLENQIKSYYLILIELQPMENCIDNDCEPNNQVNNLISSDTISKTICDIAENYRLIPMRENKFALLIYFADHSLNQLHEMLKLANEFIELVNGFLFSNVSIGMSQHHNNFDNLATAYHEAEEALTMKFYNYQTNTIHLPRSDKLNMINFYDIKDMVDSIISKVSQGLPDLAVKFCDDLYQHIYSKQYSIDAVKNLLIMLVSICSSQIMECGTSNEELTDNQTTIFKSLIAARSLQNTYGIIRPFIEKAANYNKHEVNNRSPIIIDSLNYINTNYAQPLTLHQVANHVHVSPSYLSRLLHQQTGRTFLEICRSIRVEKACSLLEETSYRNYEIAAMVGIDDPAYFSQIFKKQIGLSPSEYRSKIRRKSTMKI